MSNDNMVNALAFALAQDPALTVFSNEELRDISSRVIARLELLRDWGFMAKDA